MNSHRVPARLDKVVALLLALGTALALGLTERDVGFVRDEGYYFRAGRDYAAWYGDVWQAAKRGRPLEAFTDAAISSRFSYNNEHPVFAKTLFGLSHALFTEKLGWLREAAGSRLPAWILSGLLSALLYLLGAGTVSRRGGVFAVLAFWLTPRHFFHGHLSCFDMPVAFAWLLVVYCYWRALDGGRRWAVLTGLAYGVALANKHNAWILPGVLALHFALGEAPRLWRQGRAGALLPALRPFLAMAVLGPALFFLHWPYLWHAPVERFLWYARFHTAHINYPWQYFGELLVDPPFPWGYAFGLTSVTVPLALLVLMATGAVRELARFTGTYLLPDLKRRVVPLDSDSLLLLGNAFASLAVLSLPSIPIFGGVKHWLPSMPFLALFAARALERVSDVVAERVNARLAWPAVAALVLAPAGWGLARNHPYGTSFYNELAGGHPGGASLGMHRQYWSNNFTGVLGWLNENAPPNARVFMHEVN
ncbi:MAG: ArnT family glycosyltransferase, partial [Myxococcales bacterium]